jgi:hypothetical protein
MPIVRVEEGRVVNAGAPFSFDLPAGWELKGPAKQEDTTVVHGDSGSSCSFLLKGGGTDLEAEVRGLGMAAPFTGGKWSRLGTGWRKIGGRRAGELIALRTFEGKEPQRERSYAVIDRGQVYLIVCQLLVSQSSSLDPDVDRILETFAWSRRGKKR